MVVDVERRINLLHNAVLHDEDVVRERHCLRLVMRNIDDREAVLHLQLLDLETHLFAQMRIETGEGLIEQHHIRIDGKGPRKRNALLAAAREEVRTLICRREEIGRLERLRRALLDLLLRELADTQRERNILIDREVRPDGKRLEHHSEVALLRRKVMVLLRRREQTVANPNLTVGEILKPGDHAQGRCLAAARRAEHGEATALFDLKIQMVDGGHVAEPLCNID